MTKSLPLHDPLYYAIVANTPYKEPTLFTKITTTAAAAFTPTTRAQKAELMDILQAQKGSGDTYLKTRYPSAVILERGSTLGLCSYMLVKNGDDLTVVFKGTENDLEQLSNAANQFDLMPGLIREVDNDLLRWEKKYQQNITCLVGHSKGGYFATRVLKSTDVFRITINGQKVERGDKNINLRTSGDPIYNNRVSQKSRSILIGPGGHEVEGAISLLIGKTWADLSSVFKQSAVGVPPQVEAAAAPSPLESKVAGLEQTSNELSVKLSQDTPVVGDVNVDRQLEALSQTSPEIVAELESMSRQQSRYGAVVMQAASSIAIEVYAFFQGSEYQRQRAVYLRQMEHHHAHLREGMARNLENQEIHYTFQQLEMLIASRLNPQGVRETVQEIRDFSDQYKKDAQLLKVSLEQNRKLGQSIDDQLKNLDKLDAQTKKYYDQALKSQKKLSQRFRILGGILNATGAVLRIVPNIDPMMMAATGTVGLGNQFFAQGPERGQSRIQQRYQRAMQKNMSIREQLYEVAGQNRSQRASLLRQKQQLQDLLLEHGNLFDPATHLKALETSVEQLSQEVSELDQNLQSKQNALAKERQSISEYEAGRAFQAKQAHSSKKEKRRQARHLLKNIDTELAAQRARATALEQEIQALTPLKQKSQETLEETQKVLEDSNYLAPLSIRTWSVLVDEDSNWNPKNDKLRKLQALVQQNSVRYGQARQTEHQVVDGLMHAVSGLTAEIEKISGASLPTNAANLLSQLYQLNDLQKYWRDFAWPQLQIVRDKYSEGSYSKIVENLGPAAFVLQVVVPSLRTVSLGLSCVRMSSHLFRYATSLFQPNPPPLKERLPEYLRPLVPENLTQMTMEAELHLQALGATLQQFQLFVDERFAFIAENLGQQHAEVVKEIGEVRQCLSIVGDQLLREIATSKQEVIQTVHESAYNQHMAMIKIKENEIVKQIKQYHTQLQLAEDDAKKVDVMANFLTFIESSMQSASLDVINGMNLGLGTQSPYDHAYPLVMLHLIQRNPAYFSGLIAAKFGMPNTMPNLAFVETITKWFITVVTNTGSDTRYQQILKHNERIRSQFYKICYLISDQYEQLEMLPDQMEEAISLVHAHQQAIWQQIIHRAREVRNFKVRYLKLEQAKAKAKFAPYSPELSRGAFVGSRKFFLSHELGQKMFKELLPSAVVSGFYSHYQNSNQMARSDISFLGKVQEVVKQKWPDMLLTPIGFNTISPRTSLIPLGRDSESVIIVTATLAIYWGASWGIRNKEIEMMSRERQIRHAVNKPLKVLLSEKQPQVVFDRLRVSYHHEELCLDLDKREVVHLNPQTLACRHASLSSLLSLDVDVAKPELGIQFHPKSLVQPNDLEYIPAASHAHSTAAKYDQALNDLIDNYVKFLNHVVEGQALAAENPFSSLVSSSQVVAGVRDDMIPLVLPKKLLQTLEKKLDVELRYLEGTGIGFLVPFYQFSESQNDLFKISILYRFVSTENPSLIKEFCSFTVAEFDRTSLLSFQNDLKKPEAIRNTNEFLLQALYGSFGAKLGLPGNDTFVLPSRLIAPQEVPFAGLYRIWDKFPGNMVSYHSSRYTLAVSQALQKNVEAGPLSAEISHLFRSISLPEYGKDYLEVWRTLQTRNKEFKEAEAGFKKDFALLLALVKLVAKVDNETLFGWMKKNLRLLPPEGQETLYDNWDWLEDSAAATVVPIEQVEAFLNSLEKLRSPEYTRLQGHLEQLGQLSQTLVPRTLSIEK